MDEKKQIGLKIWELFLKNYTYKEIGKELGISKSVVSNVINYCLPPNSETIQKDIKSFKKEMEEELIKCKKNCEKKIEEELIKKQSKLIKQFTKKEQILKKSIKYKINKILSKTALISAFLTTFLIIIPLLITQFSITTQLKYYYFLNKIYYSNFIYKIIVITLIITLLFFLFKYISKLIIFITSFNDEI